VHRTRHRHRARHPAHGRALLGHRPGGHGQDRGLVEKLKKTYTIVLVTHNMQQAARVSDYTAFFFQGHIVEFGVTRQVFENPAEKQTEDYITGRFG